ncbi:hypothetical protein A3D62_02575 [Candidatus Kaiserbacteria bacterium RIFCSPHIGHO2_02_FULL_49_11]|uniref:50S ribosomal protein L35 n=1 Tax=Candidatus Kaiserbacteria bacterium RIFCSPHIGHO2_02_FULL_49_11 TaxID=1798489 RepID=A0A1F6D1H0_9BACT|nr:MAG: hypothetical protein A3D62_02575 [Candidatus Kaiserbacteria bacterium RIFCSPHIGHO2_02_FULL_49_11]
MKTNKSYTKRLRFTKTGKVVARAPGKNHFNAKESRNTQLKGKRTHTIAFTNKIRSRFIPHN